jgi:mono/diheme cytochrome c family protein
MLLKHWAGTLLLTSFVAAGTAFAGEISAKEKYVLYCAGCHGYEGEGGGGGGGTKPIAAFVPKIGLFLRDSEGRRYLVNTGGVSSAGMTDAETATVLNYVLGTFGATSTPKEFTPYTTEEITAFRKQPVADPAAMRKQIAHRLKVRGINLPAGHWD